MTLRKIKKAIEDEGLAYRGAFHPETEDVPNGIAAETIVLIGFLGGANWAAFASSIEAADGKPDPLDRWSLRVIGAIAQEMGAEPLFPFGGPPWLPFQRWAQKAETLYPSPLGMQIHPDFGLWHSWRGALCFRERIDLPKRASSMHPCESCASKPCVTSCPAGAFTPDGFDVAACVAHIGSPAGADCLDNGCRARRACPIGTKHRYTSDQAQFHLRAFRKAQQ